MFSQDFKRGLLVIFGFGCLRCLGGTASTNENGGWVRSESWRTGAESVAQAPNTRVGVMFDLDGVFQRGRTQIPGGMEALDLMYKYQIPHIILTNGGGITEAEKAEELNDLMGLKDKRRLKHHQIQLSHTPFKAIGAALGIIAEDHEGEAGGEGTVMVIGSRRYVDVMRSYGFKKIITPQEYHRQWPSSFFPRNTRVYSRYGSKYPATLPYFGPEDEEGGWSNGPPETWDEQKKKHKLTPLGEHINVSEETILKSHKEIKAVFIFPNPLDWFAEIQILLDILAPVKQDGTWQQIPLFVATVDLSFPGAHPWPRLATGAFVASLQHLYLLYFKRALRYIITGKPEALAYRVALGRLRWSAAFDHFMRIQSRKKKLPSDTQIRNWGNENVEFDVIYGVGDNPATDIRGANRLGTPFKSVLVYTGLIPPPGKKKIQVCKAIDKFYENLLVTGVPPFPAVKLASDHLHISNTYNDLWPASDTCPCPVGTVDIPQPATMPLGDKWEQNLIAAGGGKLQNNEQATQIANGNAKAKSNTKTSHQTNQLNNANKKDKNSVSNDKTSKSNQPLAGKGEKKTLRAGNADNGPASGDDQQTDQERADLDKPDMAFKDVLTFVKHLIKTHQLQPVY